MMRCLKRQGKATQHNPHKAVIFSKKKAASSGTQTYNIGILSEHSYQVSYQGSLAVAVLYV